VKRGESGGGRRREGDTGFGIDDIKVFFKDFDKKIFVQHLR